MKKLLILFGLSMLAMGVYSQQKSIPISLNLYGGYTFPDRVNLGYYSNYNNYGYINGAGQYGAGLEFFLNPYRSLELSYQYMGTNTPFYTYLGQSNKGNESSSLQYILIGGNNYFPTHSAVSPYGGLGIGVGIAHFHYYNESSSTSGNGSTSLTKFAWNLHLGVKIKTQSIVSIKLQAYLQSIVEGVGVGVGFGTGGAGAGVSTYSTMLQFGLGGGLSFDLGGHRNQQ